MVLASTFLSHKPQQQEKMARKALLILCILMFSTIIIPPKSLVAARALAETFESNHVKRRTPKSDSALKPTRSCDGTRYANCLPRPPPVPKLKCSTYAKCRGGVETPTVPSPPPPPPSPPPPPPVPFP